MSALQSVLKGMTDRVLSGSHWKSKALFIVLVVALVRAFPSYETLDTDFNRATWQSAQVKVDNLMLDTAPVFPPETHARNLTYRLTVPLLAHVLHLRRDGTLIFTAAVGILLLYTVLKIVYNLTCERRIAILVCLAIACAWPGLTAFHDLRGGYYDAVALCLLTLTMVAESAVLAGLWAFLAAWTDERALIALPLVLLFCALETTGPKSASRPKVVAILIAGAGYAITRVGLAYAYSWTTSAGGTGPDLLLQQASVVPLGIWTGLGGCWVLVAGSLWMLLRLKRYVALGIFAAAILLVAGEAGMILDLTRSAAYCLPAVLVGLAILQRYGAARQTYRLVIISAALSVVLPTLYLEGTNVFLFHPVYGSHRPHVINYPFAFRPRNGLFPQNPQKGIKQQQ